MGVVMYELLTKDKPFAGESINKLIYNILNAAPRRPTQLDTNIPEPFDAICLRALEKDPNKRYQYATDLSRDLKEFIASLQPRRMMI
jgi:serine/threonine-protein kinase